MFYFKMLLDFIRLQVSHNQTESHHGVRSEGTARQTIDILMVCVMCPPGLVSAAHRISTAAAAHEAFAEVVCQAALGPAISQVK